MKFHEHEIVFKRLTCMDALDFGIPFSFDTYYIEDFSIKQVACTSRSSSAATKDSNLGPKLGISAICINTVQEVLCRKQVCITW